MLSVFKKKPQIFENQHLTTECTEQTKVFRSFRVFSVQEKQPQISEISQISKNSLTTNLKSSPHCHHPIRLLLHHRMELVGGTNCTPYGIQLRFTLSKALNILFHLYYQLKPVRHRLYRRTIVPSPHPNNCVCYYCRIFVIPADS